jgi:hypothetical protein
MPESRGRSFVFPLILIMAGIALLADRLGMWSVNWYSLGRLWPLILVFIGLDILFRNTRVGGVISLLIAIGVVGLVALLLLTGSPRHGSRVREVFSYPAKGVRSGIVRLDVGVGQLDVVPLDESDKFLDAQVEYDKAQTRLVREISEKDNELRVTLKTTRSVRGRNPWGRTDEEKWRVGLNTRVPLSLDVNAGVNRSQLDLKGLELTHLGVNVGVGDAEVLLPGKGSYDVSIDGGVGAVRLEIPEETEARIRVDGGLGSVSVGGRYERQGKFYVTRGYGAATDKVDVDINGGVGSITIR